MKRHKYYFCDGMCGVVLAHSRKQAIKMVANDHTSKYSNFKKLYTEMLKTDKILRKNREACPYDYDFSIDEANKVNYKGKSRVLYYCE